MSWVTPLGLPVMQPYRKVVSHTVKTMLQSMTLSVEDDALPVSGQKQRSAFPPNYVHSLDSTHMLMTAMNMKKKGLTFSAVHDSYWTHACDVDVMNAVSATYIHIADILIVAVLKCRNYETVLLNSIAYHSSKI